MLVAQRPAGAAGSDSYRRPSTAFPESWRAISHPPGGASLGSVTLSRIAEDTRTVDFSKPEAPGYVPRRRLAGTCYRAPLGRCCGRRNLHVSRAPISPDRMQLLYYLKVAGVRAPI